MARIVMNRYVRFLLPVLLCPVAVFATHNRAGEITVRQINSLTIRATITTYTKASSIPADRDTLEICWGDGFCEKVARSNGPGKKGEILENDTKRNFYIAEHTYAGIGTYKISMTDPNRNGGILNVNFPNSDDVAFHLETTYTLFNPNLQGYNNSPVLLQPPIDFGCVGQRFIHNPNAYDIDGDSLAYYLIVPLRDQGTPVPNYVYPDRIEPGPRNSIRLDPVTGDFVWVAPQKAGEYNIAMIIVEYRGGKPIDTLIRDMQILIRDCQNMPPEVATITELCVVAGQVIDFNVTATDPDIPKQKVKLRADGAPLQEVPGTKATFTVAQGYQNQPLTGRFRWQTSCEHISDQPYSVVFKATDDIYDTTGLATLKTVRIKVVGPPPLDVQTKPGPGQVEVTWESPYVCENAADNYFWGFSVWRREGSNPFQPDTCRPGLNGRGYTEISFRVLEKVGNRYYYKDTNVERGRTYCYRILAQFAKRTANNQAYNFVKSLPSEEVCVQLSRDLPLITNASVQATDLANGQIFVRWTKPIAKDLDTTLNKGPYRYQVFRAGGITTTGLTEVPGASFVSPTFAGANDTVFVDNGLNTVQGPYSYRIGFYANGSATPLGYSEIASSVFLSIQATDETNNLTWVSRVPWIVSRYDIFRKNDLTGVFDSIGSTVNAAFSDKGLVNGASYCYYVRSVGDYGIKGTPTPLVNLSQIACGIPRDTVPPCPPVLKVSNICDTINPEPDQGELINKLRWTNPHLTCLGKKDGRSYRIYYRPTRQGTFSLIATITDFNTVTYEHSPEKSLAGCYAVTAIDSLGNESQLSNIVCVDNCPEYKLPNAFTPNGDGQNDVFKPYPYRFIERVEMKIFNRWGQLVFETADPDILWDGRNLQGEELAEGVYFYTCRVFERKVEGIIESKNILSGYIQMVRGKN